MPLRVSAAKKNSSPLAVDMKKIIYVQLSIADPSQLLSQISSELVLQQQRSSNTEIFLRDAMGVVTAWHKSLVLPKSSFLTRWYESTRDCHCWVNSTPELHLSLADTSTKVVAGLTTLLYTGEVNLNSQQEAEDVRQLARRLEIDLRLTCSERPGIKRKISSPVSSMPKKRMRIGKKTTLKNVASLMPSQANDKTKDAEEERGVNHDDLHNAGVVHANAAMEKVILVEKEATSDRRSDLNGDEIANGGWCCETHKKSREYTGPCDHASEEEKEAFARMRKRHLALKYAQCTHCAKKYRTYSRFREHLCSHYGNEMLTQLNMDAAFKTPKVLVGCPGKGCNFKGHKFPLARHLGTTHNLLAVYVSQYEKEEFEKLGYPKPKSGFESKKRICR